MRARLIPVKNDAITNITIGSEFSISELNGGNITNAAKYAIRNPGIMFVIPSDIDLNLLSNIFN